MTRDGRKRVFPTSATPEEALPKRDGPWESIPAIAEAYGGVKPRRKCRGGSEGGFTLQLRNKPLPIKIRSNSKIIIIRTVEVRESRVKISSIVDNQPIDYITEPRNESRRSRGHKTEACRIVTDLERQSPSATSTKNDKAKGQTFAAKRPWKDTRLESMTIG